MSISHQIQNNKQAIQKYLYLGKAHWDVLLEKVERAEQKRYQNYKDEQILTFLACCTYAIAGKSGVEKLARLLTDGLITSEKIWFEALPFPTRQYEGNTNLDLAIGNIVLREGTKSGIRLHGGSDTAICFCEFKWLSDISLNVSYDIHRNQLARVIENALLFSDGQGRMVDRVHVTLVTPRIFRKQLQFSRLYQYKWRDYQVPELLAADLDNCSLKLREGSMDPSKRVSILNLHWHSYEELVEKAPMSSLKEEVNTLFSNLEITISIS